MRKWFISFQRVSKYSKNNNSYFSLRIFPVGVFQLPGPRDLQNYFGHGFRVKGIFVTMLNSGSFVAAANTSLAMLMVISPTTSSDSRNEIHAQNLHVKDF